MKTATLPLKARLSLQSWDIPRDRRMPLRSGSFAMIYRRENGQIVC